MVHFLALLALGGAQLAYLAHMACLEAPYDNTDTYPGRYLQAREVRQVPGGREMGHLLRSDLWCGCG